MHYQKLHHDIFFRLAKDGRKLYYRKHKDGTMEHVSKTKLPIPAQDGAGLFACFRGKQKCSSSTPASGTKHESSVIPRKNNPPPREKRQNTSTVSQRPVSNAFQQAMLSMEPEVRRKYKEDMKKAKERRKNIQEGRRTLAKLNEAEDWKVKRALRKQVGEQIKAVSESFESNRI